MLLEQLIERFANVISTLSMYWTPSAIVGIPITKIWTRPVANIQLAVHQHAVKDQMDFLLDTTLMHRTVALETLSILELAWLQLWRQQLKKVIQKSTNVQMELIIVEMARLALILQTVSTVFAHQAQMVSLSCVIQIFPNFRDCLEWPLTLLLF